MAEIIKEDQSAAVPNGQKTLGETLREMFDPYDMIGIKNVTKLALEIPYLPSKNEKVISNKITKRVYGREELSEDGTSIVPGKRETLKIGPDENATISGEFAYVAIPFIINIQLQLDARERAVKNDTGVSTSRDLLERNARVKELLAQVYLGFPKASQKD
jgi:hypothetical protein